MKKLFSVLVLSIGLLLSFSSKTFATDDYYDHVNTFHSDIVLNQDSSISIKETINYHLASYEHGIYSEIPVNYKVTAAFVRPTRLVINGLYYYEDSNPTEIFNSYEQSTSNGYAVLKIGDSDTTITGDYTYVIDYKLIYAVNYFDDHDELYLNINGNGWEVPVDSVTANITVPGNITDKVCYTGVSGSTDTNCTLFPSSANTLTLTAGSFYQYEGVTVAIKMPKGTIANTTNQQRVEFILANLGIFLPVLAMILVILLSKKYNTNKKLTIIPNYDVPKGFDALSSGFIYKKGIPNNVITAQLIQLAIQGYIKIKQVYKKEYELVKTDKGTPINEQEKILYDGLFGDKDSINLKKQNSKIFETIAKTKASVEKDLYQKEYLSQSKKKVSNTIVIVGSIGLAICFVSIGFLVEYAAMGWFFGALSSFIILLIFGSKIDRKTISGNQIFYDLEGLKLYINTAEERRIEFHNDPKKYLGVFEKLLPYAMIFGLEKKWAKEFEDIYIEQPDWYDGNMNTFNSYLLINSLGGFTRQVNSYLTPTNSSHGFASSRAGFGGSGFGGGGFSGGGFGGGGGGSW